jgi:predicted GNAT family N-acyltransferase
MDVNRPIFIASKVKSQSELKQVMAVRHDVFVKEQGIDEQEEYDGLDDSSTQFVVKTAGMVIGTARVRFIAANCAKIERMAILKPYRKQGVGTMLLLFVLSQIETPQIILHAQWSAIPFYKNCGFQKSNGPFLEAGIKHIKMIKTR